MRDIIISVIIGSCVPFLPFWEWDSGIEMVAGVLCIWFISFLLLFGSNPKFKEDKTR